jgi:hypothetical protein
MELLAKMLSTTTTNTKAVGKPTRLASRPSTLTITKLSTSSNLSRTISVLDKSVPNNKFPGHCLDIVKVLKLSRHSRHSRHCLDIVWTVSRHCPGH